MRRSKRGLVGDFLELIITDGPIKTLDTVYPRIPHQRCWVHKLRNIANYLRKKDIDPCIKDARAIYNARNRKEAVEAYGDRFQS